MSSLSLNAPQSATSGAKLQRRAGMLRQVARVLTEYANRRATRQALGRLDPHMLRDCGLEPLHVRAEIAKPFWLP